jgi:chromosome segregation protein
LAREATDKT